MPYTRQASLGWSHELIAEHRVHRRLRPRRRPRPEHAAAHQHAHHPERRAPAGVPERRSRTRSARGRRSAAARAKYTALITGIKRRMTNDLDFTATYTLAEAQSQIGTAADELNANNLQDATLLYDDPRVYGPTSRTDARHSGIVRRWCSWSRASRSRRSSSSARRCRCRPSQGVDANLNSENNDLPAKALTSSPASARRRKEIGDCETWNCGRGAWRTQFNLRVSQALRPGRAARASRRSPRCSTSSTRRTRHFTIVNNQTERARSCSRTRIAGDFQQPEQRVGQIGFRFSF